MHVVSLVFATLEWQSLTISVRNKFNVEELDFEAKPIYEQKALFYAKAVPIKILSVTSPNAS